MTTQLCGCVKSHTPRPISFDDHHVLPQSWGGKLGKLVKLCPTAHRNVHSLLNLYVHHMDTPPAAELRLFSPFVRALAAEAWTQHPPNPPYTAAHP